MSIPTLPAGVTLAGAWTRAAQQILTPEAVQFLSSLHRNFNPTRLALLARRVERYENLRRGMPLTFLEETRAVRQLPWQVAPIPADLQRRWVEITGPTDRKMVLNALNSGADMFMADFEDATSPTWNNLLEGQVSMYDAVRKQISVTKDGKTFTLKDKHATLLVRPRGWHLPEKHLLVDGEPMSGSLFDFGLYFFHNARERLNRNTGIYLYLPKMESHLEARLWNEVFLFSQNALSVPVGTVRCTVLIETILGSLECEEILFELKDHITALNAGRWDYIFSCIKKFREDPNAVLPDRAQLTMTVPFMRAYTQRLVHVCHKHGAHAIGGMSAFIPSRRDQELNAKATAKVLEDKEREVKDGFDGTWVAHPDLVNTAREVFAKALGSNDHQKHRNASCSVDSNTGSAFADDVAGCLIQDVHLTNFVIPGSKITEAGARMNVNIALQYLNAWLQGIGAAAIHNLMEDAATAEISRASLWQLLRHSVVLEDGRPFSREMYQRLRDEELSSLGGRGKEKLGLSADLLDQLVLNSTFEDFLTSLAYQHLEPAPQSKL